MKRYLSCILLILASCIGPVQAQQTGVAQRVNLPIFPATGVWWTAPAGAGRWGVQVELQRASGDTDAVLTVAVFSYDEEDTSRQAWYVGNEIYRFNESWREDGYIARMPLVLRRTSEGTCLTCPDNETPGQNVEPGVDNVEIEFTNSTNAILRVDGVEHALSKAEFASQAAGTQGFWARPFQIQLQTEIDEVLPDNGLGVSYVDTVIPILRRSQFRFRGIDGWDVYEFDADGEVQIITIGPIFMPVRSRFELYVHPVLNEYFLVRSASTDFEDLPVQVQLFPLGRYVMEGRSPEIFPTGDGRHIVSQALLVSTPGMQAEDGTPLPYPLD